MGGDVRMAHIRPSELIRRALTTGDMTGVSLASVQMPIYKEACRILKLLKPDRRAEIERHPLSELLAAEVIRLHKFRRTVNT